MHHPVLMRDIPSPKLAILVNLLDGVTDSAADGLRAAVAAYRTAADKAHDLYDELADLPSREALEAQHRAAARAAITAGKKPPTAPDYIAHEEHGEVLADRLFVALRETAAAADAVDVATGAARDLLRVRLVGRLDDAPARLAAAVQAARDEFDAIATTCSLVRSLDLAGARDIAGDSDARRNILQHVVRDTDKPAEDAHYLTLIRLKRDSEHRRAWDFLTAYAAAAGALAEATVPDPLISEAFIRRERETRRSD